MEFLNMDKRFKISKILIRNLIFLLLFALLVTQTFSLGFDSATSCSPNAKQSRRGRAKMLATIPCDLTTQAYCILPGTAYPWHAVRRFVHENQGLMKRMYGDVRHISVLRDEMLNNEIDIDDIELASERYSRDGYNHRGSKFMHNRDEFDNFKANDVLREPHFRPLIAPATISTTSTIKPTSSENSESTTTTTERVETTVVANDLEKSTTPDTTTISAKTTTQSEDNTNFDTDSKSDSADETSITANDFVETQQQLIEENKEDRENLEEDVLIEFNSIYETSGGSSSPPTNALLGDNIEIVESPQLGLINITLEYVTTPTVDLDSEISTTTSVTTAASTTAKKPTTFSTTTTSTTTPSTTITPTTTTTTTTTKTTTTTPKTETVAERSPAKQQRKPFVPSSSNRHRPQQLHKIDSTISAKLKLKMNPTQTTPFKTFTSTMSSSNSTRNQTASSTSSTHLTTPLTSTKSSLPLKANSNKNYNRYTTLNNNRYGMQPTSSPASQLASSAQPFKGNADLLLGEKLRKPVANATPATQASNRPVLREGQLFQDTMKQEPAPIANARGVNACPVKEEVVAPFWANNTRGEVLALLNLYPFEQYVHWEKCTHEHKQMYCREGCRCEQQYRLHRLLAYDPNNECRGIFSDWFRFPSCCICKCYNIPLDFRATSRSPRAEGGGTSDHRHPIEVAEERVKNAIYEHATEDWYRPKEEFDLYDG